MKILITGGAGFIGAHLAKKLIEQGHQITIIDNFNGYYDPKLKKDRVKVLLSNKKYQLYKTDICNYQKMKLIFKKHKPDIVCHLAAMAGVRYSMENPFKYEEANVKGTLTMLELAKEFKIKGFIFASSSSVYGDNSKIPFSEDDRTDHPISPYAATKKATEGLAYCYHHNYGLRCTGLRFFTVYGPWGRPDMATFKFTKNIFENQTIELYNRGNMMRDFTYIDDIVSGIIKAIKKNHSFEIINLGNNKPENLKYFIKVLEHEIGKKAKKKLLPMPKGEVLKTYASITKAKKLLGFKPKTLIEQGLKEFVKWYMEYYKIKFKT